MKKKTPFAVLAGTLLTAAVIAPVPGFAAQAEAELEAGLYFTSTEGEQNLFYTFAKWDSLSEVEKSNLVTKYNHTNIQIYVSAMNKIATLDAAIADGSFDSAATDFVDGDIAGTFNNAATGEDFTVGNEVVDLTVESVSAINPTSIQVTFNGDLTEEQAAKANFSLSKGTIEAVNVTGNVATISVSGLTYGNETTVTVGNPAHTETVRVPAVSELFELEIETDAKDNNDTIISDGAAKTQVTVTLKDKLTGEVVDRDGIVQFQATDGGLGQTTSALVDGKATVQLTSVASALPIVSTLTATVSDVPGAQEFKGLTAQKVIIFSPDVAPEGEVKFVTAVSAESSQGDRLHVTFSNKISAKDYKKIVTTTTGNDAWSPTKSWGIVIDGRYVKVKDVVNVTDNTLQFILDVDDAAQTRIENNATWKTGTADADGIYPVTGVTANYLRDNAEHTVSFPNNVGTLVLANKTGVKFILTDASRPAVYGVTATDQLNLEVRYTESVKHNVAIDAENYLIDGKKLVVDASPSVSDIAKAKAENKIIVTKIENGVYTPATATAAAKDERNLVKLVVHSEFALATGKHSIAISNILDYAGDIDPVQNKLESDKFDFNVVADDSKPLASIEVQSAEQWLVTYDKVVSTVGAKQAKDVFTIETNNPDDAKLEYGTDYTVYQVDKTGVVGAELAPTSTITNGQYFLIEFKRDWTDIYNTKANPSKTYYASTQNDYKVTVENVKSVFGNVAEKQDLTVTLAYDGTSPKLVTATDVYALEDKQYLQNDGAKSTAVKVSGKEILVTFNEPIKVNSDGLEAAEGKTPSQVQDDVAAGDIPASTYEFTKGDKVVKAKVVALSLAANDKSFVLVPDDQLEAGDWIVNIRSLTDDIGNSIATDHFTVTILPTTQSVTSTQIAWVGFDDAELTPLLGKTDKAGDKALPNAGLDDYDAIYVKFTKEMNPFGALAVDLTQNYVFMDNALPTGSKVVRGIEGVTKNWDGVTILVPTGTWNGDNNDYSVALNIASNFTAADGEKLSGAYEVEIFDGDISTAKADDELEAVYTQTNGIIVAGSTKAAVLSATAYDNGTFTGDPAALNSTPNGKVDTIELTTNVDITPVAGYEISVNGSTFVYKSGTGKSNALVFEAKDAKNEIVGTATSSLKVTNTNGAILVNAGSVVDASAPVITKAVLNSDKVTLTFSEAVYRDNNFNELLATDADSFEVAGTPATSVEQTSANTVVLTIGNAGALTAASAITVGTGSVVVDGENIAWATPFVNITGTLAAGPAAPVGLTPTSPTTVGGADGKIGGLTAGTVYQTSNDAGTTWVAATLVGTDITGLEAGTYLVRVAATATTAAGAASSPVVIAPFSATAPAAPNALGGTLEITSVDDTMEYKLASDATWTAVPASATSVTSLVAGNYEVRVKANATTGAPASAATSVTVQNAAPLAITITSTDTTGAGNDGTIAGLTAGKTYELHDGTTWTTATLTGAEIQGLSAGTYKVREAASVDGLTPVGAESNVVTIS